jgi:hypothetical protein
LRTATPPAFGHVVDEKRRAVEPALVQRRGPDLRIEERAIRPSVRGLRLHDGLVVVEAGEALLQRDRPLVVGPDGRERPTDHRRAVPVERALGRRIPQLDDAVAVDRTDGDRCGVDDRREPSHQPLDGRGEHVDLLLAVQMSVERVEQFGEHRPGEPRSIRHLVRFGVGVHDRTLHLVVSALGERAKQRTGDLIRGAVHSR